MDNQTEKTTLSLDELKEIRQLNCSSNMIADAKGIDKLVNIIDLNLSNNNISSIDINRNVELKNLELKNNLIENIDVSKNVNLQKLDLSNNKIRSIFLTNNLLLEELDISNNELKELDIKNNLNLIRLSLQHNNFSKEIDSSNSSFHSAVQYNPYFSSKQEDISYTSSNKDIVTVSDKGELEFLSQGNAKITKRYLLKNEDSVEEIKEVNHLTITDTKKDLEDKQKIQNVPYILVLGITLFVLGIVIIVRHLNLEEKNK